MKFASVFSQQVLIHILHILSQNMYWSGLGSMPICSWCTGFWYEEA